MRKYITLTDTWTNPVTKKETEIEVKAFVTTEQEDYLKTLGIDPYAYLDMAMKKQIGLIKENKNRIYKK
jgi:hypothetical protein